MHRGQTRIRQIWSIHSSAKDSHSKWRGVGQRGSRARPRVTAWRTEERREGEREAERSDRSRHAPTAVRRRRQPGHTPMAIAMSNSTRSARKRSRTCTRGLEVWWRPIEQRARGPSGLACLSVYPHGDGARSPVGNVKTLIRGESSDSRSATSRRPPSCHLIRAAVIACRERRSGKRTPSGSRLRHRIRCASIVPESRLRIVHLRARL